MAPNLKIVGGCPKCQSGGVVCRFNYFDRGDLQIHSWEHKCPDCGWRETKAIRSDEPAVTPGSVPGDPGVCPLCGRQGDAHS